MSQLLYIVPVCVESEPVEREMESVVRPGNEMRVVGFTTGPRHLEYHCFGTINAPSIIHAVLRAEQEGIDAAIIGCFYDTALHESREAAERIVVTGPCEAAVLFAASLGATFSVIVGRRKWIPRMRDRIRSYGLGDRLASFRSIDLGVLDFHANEEETVRRFISEGRNAIEQDGAETIILGCTASIGFFHKIQDALSVPVIDSAIAAVKHAEYLVEMRDSFGWHTSKCGSYETPPQDEMAHCDFGNIRDKS